MRLVLGLGLMLLPVLAATANEGLVGLWEGKRIAGPEVQGRLIISRSGDQWSADISGYRLPVEMRDGRLSFEAPGGRGGFAGRLRGLQIVGHWTQPGTINNGMPHSSPVVLEAEGDATWRGAVVPLLDEFSIYLPVWENDDGSLAAFLRNPDRGFGVFYNVRRVELHGDRVHWIGPFFRNEDEQVLTEATYEPGRMAVNIRGNLYDLRKGNEHSGFYARGKAPLPYRYQAPPALDDGWKTGTLAEAGIDQAAIGRFIEQVILPPADSIDDPYVHGFLMARSGKLILEEYFHGFHRDKAHDTRSASKSMASVLAGAVVHAELGLEEHTPVYATLDPVHTTGLETPLDPRRTRMTLRHLVTMSSGLECDDGDSNSRGNEDRMQSQQEQPDWYRWTATLDMVREPGEKAVYCTGGTNLIGAVIRGATGRTLAELFHELIAEPLDIDNYHLNLAPTGVPYLGGGVYWKPRDFMKLGQVMLDGGRWNGHRIISEGWAERSISTQLEMQNMGYGYAWWIIEYPYRDGKVQAFFAAGNGGQIVMGIPELELLIAFYAGNYSHPTLYQIQRRLVPEYILPAVTPVGP